jgi:hypothetical protein
MGGLAARQLAKRARRSALKSLITVPQPAYVSMNIAATHEDHPATIKIRSTAYPL